MAGILQVDAFQLPYSEPSARRDKLLKSLAGRRAIDALIHVLDSKKWEQEGKPDRYSYAMAAATGTGKSTTMIYELYLHYLGRRDKKGTILCTQPRVNLVGNQVASIQALFPDIVAGKNLAYSTGTRLRLAATGNNKIEYCTTQTLVNRMITADPAKFARNYPIIVIDEAHDASNEMLVMLQSIRAHIRAYYTEHSPLFLIASATIYPPTFSEYLLADPKDPYNAGFIAGSTPFPIEQRYLTTQEEAAFTDSIQAAASKTIAMCGEIVEKSKALEAKEGAAPLTQTDIMAFWPTLSQIRRYLQAVNEGLKDFKDKTGWKHLPIEYTRLEVIRQSVHFINTYKPQEPKEIRIIAATPTMEAGVTLPHLYGVVDTGKRFAPIPFPLTRQMSGMYLPISELSRIQRMGRVGRVAPGVYQGLFTEKSKLVLPALEYASTLTSSNVPTVIFNLILSLTTKKYLQAFGDPLAVALILALRRSKFPQPSIDIVNDLELLHPASMEMSILAMHRLLTLNLADRSGALTLMGLQLAFFKSPSIAESFLRSYLQASFFNIFDIELLCTISRKSFMATELGNRANWSDSVKMFYPDKSFMGKNPPARMGDMMGVWRACQSFVELLFSTGMERRKRPPHKRSWEPKFVEDADEEAPLQSYLPMEEWEKSIATKYPGMDTASIKDSVYNTMNTMAPTLIEGAFFYPMYAQEGASVRDQKDTTCVRALLWASDRIEGRTDGEYRSAGPHRDKVPRYPPVHRAVGSSPLPATAIGGEEDSPRECEYM